MGPAGRLPWSREEFERQLRAKGERYHIHHPFHVAMNNGRCTRAQVQGWVLNRFYYQVSIPIKDAAILANMPDRDQRRRWIQRILDHDGAQGAEGGIEAWLRLGEAVGLARDEVTSLKHVLPGVRFAVDAYVNFARRRPWQEAVCASLTELFAPEIHKERLPGAPRRRARPRSDAGAFPLAWRAGTGARDPPVQARYPLEHARCDAGRLRHR